MRTRSIRLRLWSTAAVSILVALAIAGAGLLYLFESHVERRVVGELSIDLDRLVGATSFAADGSLHVDQVLTDARFDTPESGYYWQVESLDRPGMARSRSLWDAVLMLAEHGDRGINWAELLGPDRARLIAVTRIVSDAGGASFRATVAEDHRTVERSVEEYAGQLTPALILLALVLITANFAQITIGLAPLERLRVALRDVVTGRNARLNPSAPREVQPLTEEINRLLEVQERALSRARSRATDLAHGLKTPLQVMSADIRLLRDRGETGLADDIEKNAAAIRRHIDRELARSRLAPGIAAKMDCRVAPVVGGVLEVVRRTPGSEGLRFLADVPPELTLAIDEGDLTELIGNLVENAARYARTVVRIEAHGDGNAGKVAIIDDGPGILDADKDAVLMRGVRLDAKRGGSGLGLAIVADIVAAYGGNLRMADESPGLRIEIDLPSATEQTGQFRQAPERSPT